MKRIILFLSAVFGMAKYLSARQNKESDMAYVKKTEESVKFRRYYNTLIAWMGLLQKGGTISAYFNENDRVAVYGMGKIGELVCCELMKNGVTVCYGIDGNISGKNLATGLKVYFADENKLPDVDFVIVSISHLSDNIISRLENVMSAKIITIDEIIDDLREDKR